MTNKELVLKFYDEVFNNWIFQFRQLYERQLHPAQSDLLRAEKKAL